MKTIAISSDGESLDAKVQPLFGRSRFFILADPETLEWEVLDNMYNLSSLQQVGVMTAQNLVRKNIRTVITGKCGSKAFKELTEAGVQVLLDTQGTGRQALEQFLRGDFIPATSPNVSEARA
jgi:predicted Fe-Mo cluster-binding NifX family protein